jgi:hypothetical protein
MSFTNYGISIKKGAVAIADVVTVAFPELSMEEIDVTSHSSGGYKEYIPNGVIDPGEVAVTCNYSYTAFASFVTDMEAGTTSTYTLVFSGDNNGEFTFDAWVKGLSMEDMDATDPAAAQFTVTLRPTGEVSSIA